MDAVSEIQWQKEYKIIFPTKNAQWKVIHLKNLKIPKRKYTLLNYLGVISSIFRW